MCQCRWWSDKHQNCSQCQVYQCGSKVADLVNHRFPLLSDSVQWEQKVFLVSLRSMTIIFGFVSTSNCSWSRFCCRVCFGIWRKGWNALECYLHSPMLPPEPEQQAKLARSDTVSLNGAFSTISSFVSCLQLAWAEWPSSTIICQSHYFYQCYRHFMASFFFFPVSFTYRPL